MSSSASGCKDNEHFRTPKGGLAQATDRNNVSATTTTSKPEPILIPPPRLQARDINRVPTPLSGRGDRKGHLFPFSRSPSPGESLARSFGKSRTFSAASSDSEQFFGRLERVRSASPCSSTSSTSRHGSLNMPDRAVAVGHYPTSPLSPKPSARKGLSPQNSQRRGNHGRQASRNMQLNLGRFHPSNFSQADASSMAGGPQITYTRAPPPVQMESPRLLREKHREFLQQAQLSSKLAASPLSAKPDAPRLDPLGSPKGAVTPLALEEAGDYFSTAGAGKISPAGSPGTRSPRATSVSSDDDTKPSKSRKIATS
ncbi:hypothetical protein PMZ80_005767 [Knufia obscura]|uniref:Uncharacterized protein n=2 Tax=Knufia TaxID=430999 RepID=A0AAN8F095_9EURO|nr:hypothetical protein PMZ80_005767 [Knufia obscura]KAK5954433.1 hypothetical protein OHC33_004155 [Knufia fluminis]